MCVFLFSENSSEILKKINDESLIPVLINFLNAELFEFENVLITGKIISKNIDIYFCGKNVYLLAIDHALHIMTFPGQCLYTLTEQNPTAAAMIVESNSCLKIIEKNLLCSDAKEELLLFKVNMAGHYILLNLSDLSGLCCLS